MGYTTKAFALSLIIFFSLPDSYHTLFELHPDETMLAFYFIGIYYLYSYLESKKQKELNISFLMFAVSFLILQKILIILSFVGIYILYLICNKQISIKPVMKATLLPLFIILIFILWLYCNGCLKIYYLFNYDLNVIMHKFYKLGKVYGDYWQTLYLPVISLFALKDFIKDRNIYKIFFVFVFVMECASKYVFGALYKHYFVFSNIMASIIIGEFIYRNIKQKQIKLLLFIMIASSIYLFDKTPLNKYYPQYYKMQKYMYSFMQKDDYLISTVNYINIYENDVSYYWFAGGNIAPVAHYLYQYKEPFLLNEYILKYKPKFIYNNLYVNQIILVNFINDVSYEEYISNLQKIYNEIPVKLETRENFVKRWSLKEFSSYDDNRIRYNYIPHPYFPLLVRRDLVH